MYNNRIGHKYRKRFKIPPMPWVYFRNARKLSFFVMVPSKSNKATIWDLWVSDFLKFFLNKFQHYRNENDGKGHYEKPGFPGPDQPEMNPEPGRHNKPEN